jgi:hypothetical protein
MSRRARASVRETSVGVVARMLSVPDIAAIHPSHFFFRRSLMKRSLSPGRMLPGLILAAVLVAGVNAQPCSTYFPFSEGAQFELQSFNAKNKLTGSTSYQILSVTNEGGASSALVRMQPVDAKNRPGNPIEYTVQCRDGNMFVEMRSFLDPETMKAYKDMDVTLDANYLEVPANLAAGAILNDGQMEVKVANEGRNMATLSVAITNRRVDAAESITTPAGTFDAVKITSDMEMGTRAMGIKLPSAKFSSAEWYVKDVGVVRSESYRKGKLFAYNVLTKLER